MAEDIKVTGGGKGGLTNVTPQSGVLLDDKTNASILTNMEKLAAEINSPWRKFNENLKDMTAWTQYNKGPAFALREEAANTDRNTLYNIRQQQAAFQEAQLQAQADAAHIAQVKQKMMGGAGATGAGGVGAAGGPNPAQQQLLSAMETLRPREVGAQRELINKFNEAQIAGSSKAQYDAGANSPVTYMVPGKGPVSITPNQWNNMDPALKRSIEMATYKELGSVPPPPGGGATVQGGAPSLGAAAMTGERGNAAQIAASLNIPLISGDRDWDKQYSLYLNSKQPGYSGPPVAFPGTSKHQTGYAIDVGPITPAQRQQLTDSGFKQTVARDPNHWELVSPAAPARAQAPIVSGGAPAQTQAPIVSGGAPSMRPIPVANTLSPGESIVNAPAAAKPIVTAQAPVVTPAQAPVMPQAPAQGPSAVESAAAVEPMPQAKDFGLNKDAYLAAMEAWKTRQSQRAQGLGAASTDLAKVDADKKNEYLSSIGTTSKTYDEYKRLLDSSKDKKGVFNLAGQSWYGPVAAKITPKMETDPTEHHAIARTWLPEKNQTDFKNIEQGASVAQAAWAKNLVQGAGGRLTNADLALGKPAKGVGIETTYESHMENLAKNMQDIRTAYYRGLAFDKFSRQNPNATAAQFEQTPYYEFGSKADAAKDVGKEFKDVPEANFVKKDTNGKPYVIINGKGIYL